MTKEELDYLEIEKYIEELGDSFYFLKLKSFKSNFRELELSFKSRYNNFRIGYSYKTNYIPRLCKEANNLGAYAEIVSGLELKIALKLGIDSKNLIANGPIVDKEVLEYCLINNSKVNIDNLEQFKCILNILNERKNINARIGIRLNLDLKDGEFSRFGIDPASEDFKLILDEISVNPRIFIIGLHFHATRSDKSVISYLKRLSLLIDLYHKLANNHCIEYLDLGGGFFGPMDDNIQQQFQGKHYSYDEYGMAIAGEMKRHFPDERVELIIEPGLALTVNVLDFYTRVTNIKTIQTKRIINTNGSFYNIKPSGHKKKLTVKVHSSIMNSNYDNQALITGFTCLENDFLYQNYCGVKLEVGDFLQFKNVGAYTIVFNPPFIQLSPKIVHIENGMIIIDREKEEFESVFKSYVF